MPQGVVQRVKQVIIVAPGLADQVGYEFEYTAAVARAFRCRGYSVSILGAWNAAPEVAELGSCYEVHPSQIRA